MLFSFNLFTPEYKSNVDALKFAEKWEKAIKCTSTSHISPQTFLFRLQEKLIDQQHRDESSIDFDSPADVEFEGKINSLHLYRVSVSKRILYFTLSILSVGFVALLCLWFPALYILLNLKKATLKNATKIVVRGEGNLFHISRRR